MNKRTELLSPAGKWDALISAVQNGADAVYLGEKSFSARKNAHNFSWEEIKEAVKYCHIRDVKLHLALNTLLSDSELSAFEKSVKNAADAGVDALIIQDVGGAHIAHSVCPEMELHASTQLTACNACDADALQKCGFSRIVLSRELSAQEIEHIHHNTDVELEAFVHGALCISFSGKCLMSSFIGGRSGNRGMCAQPCRQLYSFGNKNGYFLSPKDLCLADELRAMYTAGITSFKIEGRMKSPEYVGVVTSVYRKYLDSFSPLEKYDEERLKKVFIRGDSFTKAYFCQKNTPEIMNYSISNDNISSKADESVLKEIRATYKEGAENKKVLVDAHLFVNCDKPSSLWLTDKEFTVCAYGSPGEIAKTLPLSFERAEKQISKLGQTPFKLNNFEFTSDANSTLPVSELNSLRRKAAELLAEKKSHIEKRATFDFDYKVEGTSAFKKPYIAAEITSPLQFSAAGDADRILVPINLWDKITPDERCFVVLPQVVTDEKEIAQMLSEIPHHYGAYVSSLGMAYLAKSQGRKIYFDWGMNIYNSVTPDYLKGICDGMTLSPELTLTSVKSICRAASVPCEILCHGYQRVMTSRACLIRGITGKCDCKNPIRIKDKTGSYFTIMGDSTTHLCTVLNSRITFTADKLPDIRKAPIGGIRLYFCTESPQEVKETIDMYLAKIPFKKPQFYTRGYLFK